MNSIWRIIGLAGLLLLTESVSGQPSFFGQQLPVADRSERILSQTVEQALAQVFIRVAGDEQVVRLPAVREVISQARNHLSLYTYEDRDGALELLVEFDGAAVKKALRESGATYWNESRPSVLVWLVMDDSNARRFASREHDNELIAGLVQAFAARGITLRLPLLDLEDAAALTPDSAWRKVIPEIKGASTRYGTEHILVGRVVQLSQGRRLANWLYVNSDQQLSRQDQGVESTGLTARAVDMVVDTMAARYAVRLGTEADFQQLSVVINRVASYNDYRDVLAIFESIAVLSGVRVAAVEADVLRLSVGGVNSAAALSKLLPPGAGLAILDSPEGRELNLMWEQAR